MSVEEVKIASWDVFRSIVEEHAAPAPSMNDMLYRGQSNSEWRLESSLTRVFRPVYEIHGVAQPLVVLDALATEKRLTEGFLKHRHVFGQPSPSHGQLRMLDAWAVMQHHGCPTRLLDWTESPYVAAYFAVRDNVEVDGAVFMLSRRVLSASNQSKGVRAIDQDCEELFFSEKPENVAIVLESDNLLSARMPRQQSVLLVSKFVLNDYAGAPDWVLPGGQRLFRKLIIPGVIKATFLYHLAQMNITGFQLFGDTLDSLCLSLRETALMEAWHHHARGNERTYLQEQASLARMPVAEE